MFIFFFSQKTNSEFSGCVNQCYENDYMLVFDYAKNGDLHNNLYKNFKEID